MAKTKKARQQEDETPIFAGDERVARWRFEWLSSAGYNHENAVRIADDPDIDLHFAVDLRKKCTDESLCMRIHYGS